MHVAEVLTPEVPPGGQVAVHYEYDVLRDNCRRHIQVWRVNDVKILLYTHAGSTTGQGNGRRSATVTYPVGHDIGPHTIRVSVEWYCNPLLAYTTHYPEAHFTVVE